jgi:C-terminal processing protease CtpA/Prc
MHRVCLSLLLAGAAFAQTKLVNPGFEEGELGSVPAGWFLPPDVASAGFTAKAVDQTCRAGARCAMLTGVANPPENMFGNLMQSLPATGYNLRRIRLRAAIRVEGPNTRAQLWLRLDRTDNSMAFLENMSGRPVTSPEWKPYDIVATVPEDASRIILGVMLFGPGNAWVDDVTLDILEEVYVDKPEPARPLTPQGLTNLTAFARLYGYVRFFHPSDQAALTDWETFAIEGVRAVEGVASLTDLQTRLEKLFQPIAPTVQIFPSARRPAPTNLPPAAEIIRYRHNGVGLPTSALPSTPYKSERVKSPANAAPMPEPFAAELVPGLSASVPLALYVDSEGTLPRAPKPGAVPLYERSAEDRATRLAGVIIAWNVFQHFYPYFDVVKTDWPAELPKALRTAATHSGTDEFETTLGRLVAALKDGHGSVLPPRPRPILVPPLTLGWIEDQFVVTRVQKGRSEGIAPGDRILKIDGKPIDRAAAEARSVISGATEQWIRWRLVSVLSTCNSTARMTLEIEPYLSPGTAKTVDLACGAPKPKDMETYTEPRPEKIAELEPGILYVDLGRVTDTDWKEVVPRLEKAKGIIFDMRGYPGQPAILAIEHLTDSTIRSAKWNVPLVSKPDRIDFAFTESGWDLQPAKPRFTAPRVFLTDGRAISYAETVMGIVENYKLGGIVGGPTAGTNGNVNPFKLPGGFTLTWTGMKVLKHDGSQHHGIGILPTVPVSRTRKGVAEGKDEILLRAIEVVQTGDSHQLPRFPRAYMLPRTLGPVPPH